LLPSNILLDVNASSNMSSVLAAFAPAGIKHQCDGELSLLTYVLYIYVINHLLMMHLREAKRLHAAVLLAAARIPIIIIMQQVGSIIIQYNS
jgi:hypothetical protein